MDGEYEPEDELERDDDPDESEEDDEEPEEEEPDDEDPDEEEPDEEDDPGCVVAVAPLDPPDAVEPFPVVVLPEPACSFATTTPIKAVAPVAASTATRVKPRTRDCARSRSWGVCDVLGLDMWIATSAGGDAPYLTRCRWTPSQGPLWACCDIVPYAMRAPRSPVDTIAGPRHTVQARGDECPR
jgi:hypothetical protein